MKYERFEDLPVWLLAIELARGIYELTKDRFFNQPGDLRDQLRRSSLSVSNNIAEGFERGSTAELLAFLYISRGSCGETRSMLLFTEQFPETAHLKSMPVRSLGEGGSNFPPRSLLSGEISPRADRSQIKGRIMLTADSQLGG